MTESDAISRIHRAIEEVYQAGFVLNGQILFVKPVPSMVGRVQSVASILPADQNRGVTHIKIFTHPVPTPASHISIFDHIQVETCMGSPGVAEAVIIAGQSHQVHEVLPLLPNNGQYTGESCFKCGSVEVVRNGTCGKCLNCGESMGCS